MKSTQDIPVPQKIVDQVVGQDEAVQIIKKAALQRRHVLLIGEPDEDVPPLRARLTLGEETVGVRRLDFAAPHRFDGCEIASVDRHCPKSVSKPTIVAMPAAMRST